MVDRSSNSVLLYRRWSSAWDAARYTAEPTLRRAAFSLSSCAAQLELASEAVLRIREAVGASVDRDDALPLEGRSGSLLALALDGAPVMPEPTKDPLGFVQALVHAALQTGDGNYGLGLGEEAVTSLLQAHCGDLLAAASRLQDPAAALDDLRESAAQLRGAVEKLLERAPQAGQEAVALSAKVLPLNREMRRLAERLQLALSTDSQESSDAQTTAPTGSETPEHSEEVLDQAEAEAEHSEEVPDQAVAEAPEEPEALADAKEKLDLQRTDDVVQDGVEAQHATRLDDTQAQCATDQQLPEESEPEEGLLTRTGSHTHAANADHTEDSTDFARTKSQVIKRLKVEEVNKALEERRMPVKQLSRLLSQLEKPKGDSRAADELAEVQKLQHSLRNFGEDLMEGMLALDQLSGLADQDRQVRKDTLRGIQELLDEIDAAKPRLAKMQKHLADKVEKVQNVSSAEPQRERVEKAERVERAEREAPRRSKARKIDKVQLPQIDWRRVRLPVKFSAVENPRAYLVSASVPGLDRDSVGLRRDDENVLAAFGMRSPTREEQQELWRAVDKHLRSLPAEIRERCTQADLAELIMQLGHGRFGLFREEFEVPRDVDWSGIESSYEDGVLRIVLPRQARAAYRPAHFGGYRMPEPFLW
mmetsp:Transcript_16978/g.37285  ORF Transcript_16978/g.37285 Transcript_16978/m.37285 type:complete len:648 (+) Transcript_16978:75-2018(+)